MSIEIKTPSDLKALSAAISKGTGAKLSSVTGSIAKHYGHHNGAALLKSLKATDNQEAEVPVLSESLALPEYAQHKRLLERFNEHFIKIVVDEFGQLRAYYEAINGNKSDCVIEPAEMSSGAVNIHNGSVGFSHSAHPNIDESGSVEGMISRGYWKESDNIISAFGCYYNMSELVVDDLLDLLCLFLEASEDLIDFNKRLDILSKNSDSSLNVAFQFVNGCPFLYFNFQSKGVKLWSH